MGQQQALPTGSPAKKDDGEHMLEQAIADTASEDGSSCSPDHEARDSRNVWVGFVGLGGNVSEVVEWLQFPLAETRAVNLLAYLAQHKTVG